MSLKPCPECGRVTSSAAAECPYCRFRFRPGEKPALEPEVKKEQTLRQLTSVLVLVIFAGAIVAAAVLISPPPRKPESPEVEEKVAAPQPKRETQERTVKVPEEEKGKPEPPEPAEVTAKQEKAEEKPAEKVEPPKTLAEKRAEELLSQAKEAYHRSDWKAAIEALEPLVDLLAKDDAAAGEIERLIYLARIELEIVSATGVSKNILKGLFWLAEHQDEDGRWDQDGFHKHCQGKACDGRGTSQYDVAVTGLALFAFMGHGQTHRVGQLKRTVKRGLDWLVSRQQGDGSLGPRLAESWIYNHAIGTLALCEAYAITRDNRLKEPVQKAVGFILSAQNPGLGWKYEPQNGRNDTSVTGWMVLALKAAKIAGVEVNLSAFDGAINWFDRATNTAGKTGYMRPGDDGSVIRKVNEHFAKLPTMTAVAVICRMLCGQKRNDPKVQKGVDILMANLPHWNKPGNDRVDMYYWYYGTFAMFRFGGKNWRTWRSALGKAVLDTQRIGGCADGSWDPVGKWGMVGGRIYSTAMCVLTLQLLESGTVPHAEPKKKRKINLAEYVDRTLRVQLKNGHYFEGKLSYADDHVIILKMRDNSLRELKREDIKSMWLIK